MHDRTFAGVGFRGSVIASKIKHDMGWALDKKGIREGDLHFGSSHSLHQGSVDTAHTPHLP
jgi:hypothetical protein